MDYNCSKQETDEARFHQVTIFNNYSSKYLNNVYQSVPLPRRYNTSGGKKEIVKGFNQI